MKEFETVFIGRSKWYWVKENKKAYKCQYAASGECSPAKGEEKDVLEFDGKHFVVSGNKLIKID